MVVIGRYPLDDIDIGLALVGIGIGVRWNETVLNTVVLNGNGIGVALDGKFIWCPLEGDSIEYGCLVNGIGVGVALDGKSIGARWKVTVLVTVEWERRYSLTLNGMGRSITVGRFLLMLLLWLLI